MNIWWEPEATRQANWFIGLDALQPFTLNLEPEQVVDLHYYWPIASKSRLLRVFGHRHFWDTDFSSWIQRKNGGPS